MIVAKSLDYVTKSVQRETHYVNQIKDLQKQNERLRKQAKISKLATTNKHHLSGINKTKTASSTCTTSTTSTDGPPMTPPLSSSSSNASSCTMQRSSTLSSTSQISTHNKNVHQMASPVIEVNQYHKHQQMSPPLTPETPNKKQRTSSPLMDNTTWADPSMVMMATTMPTSTTITSNATAPHHGDMTTTMMMMPPQQWPVHASDPMFSTPSLDLYSANSNNNNNFMYNTPSTNVHQPSMLQNATHYMSLSDSNINPMLFSSYQWQDSPPVYHPPVAKSSDPLYLA
ncbi:unnamed protein product [Absidia cylindrospora]